MRISQVEFAEGSLRHITSKRDISEAEVQSACYDAFASIGPAKGTRKAILGQAESGAYLTVIGYVEQDTFRIITCRAMNACEKSRYKERKKRRHG